ncbi:hypothetical protein P154DRAFT_572590 [Amniculicola lignicola CBS 123094]|uniref:Uncharacterized protein n=1 Tax=Amniculicola lignicola CBS 123094 TaxID=1392246 RepID=A0A6A5WR16_9PLEO|nr:hypothetical protein P154DRAFT_572590 [Amniculicola lignicola CBS 123094]
MCLGANRRSLLPPGTNANAQSTNHTKLFSSMQVTFYYFKNTTSASTSQYPLWSLGPVSLPDQQSFATNTATHGPDSDSSKRSQLTAHRHTPHSLQFSHLLSNPYKPPSPLPPPTLLPSDPPSVDPMPPRPGKEYHAVVFLIVMYCSVIFLSFIAAMVAMAVGFPHKGGPAAPENSTERGNWGGAGTGTGGRGAMVRGEAKKVVHVDVPNDLNCGDNENPMFDLVHTIKFWVDQQNCHRFRLREEETCYILGANDVATHASRIYFPAGYFKTRIYHDASCDSPIHQTFEPYQLWENLPAGWSGSIGAFRSKKCGRECQFNGQ